MNKSKVNSLNGTRWLSLFAGLLFLGYLGGCASDMASDASKAQLKFQKGLEQGSINDQKGMIASFKEAVELSPQSELFRLHLGMAYFLAGDLVNAEKTFNQTLEINKESKDAYRQLGRLYMRTGEWSRAVENFKEDLIRPGTPEPHRVYNWLALSYYNQGQFDDAEREWKKTIELKDNAAIRLNLALAYKDQERFDQALESLQKAVALNPEFTQAHYELSQLLIIKKQMDQAVEHFKKVIKLAPKSEWARVSRKYLELIQQPR